LLGLAAGNGGGYGPKRPEENAGARVCGPNGLLGPFHLSNFRCDRNKPPPTVVSVVRKRVSFAVRRRRIQRLSAGETDKKRSLRCRPK